MIFFEIIISILLLVMVYQDFKYRAISWYLIPITLVMIIINSLQQSIPFNEMLINSIINIGIVASELFLISIYFSLKNRSITNIINKYIGIGDILFFVPLCFFFSPVNFIIFKIVALFLSLLIFLIYTLIKKNKHNTIPMAGALSIALVVVIFMKNLIGSELLNNDYLLGVIMKIYE